MAENVVRLIWDARCAHKKGAGPMAQRQRARFDDIVARARSYSPIYRELYRDLPDRIESAEQLPVTDKKALMARFDDWCVDRTITLEAEHGLDHVVLERAQEPPEQSTGGKFRQVIPLPDKIRA